LQRRRSERQAGSISKVIWAFFSSSEPQQRIPQALPIIPIVMVQWQASMDALAATIRTRFRCVTMNSTNCIADSRHRRGVARVQNALINKAVWAALLAAVAAQTGCQVLTTKATGLADNAVVTADMGAGPQIDAEAAAASNGPVTVPSMRPPAELSKVTLPDYRVEPPDILLIQAMRMTPKNPYMVQTLDILQIVAAGVEVTQPIAGAYQVETSGVVSLGPSYGMAKIAGLTLEEAADAIVRQLRQVGFGDPQVSVSLLQMSGQQQIAGEHLVGPDGTINLGIYGRVQVTGLTLDEARRAVENHLSHFMDGPRVSLDVLAYNSKVFYIITEGAGFGDQIAKVPITGNETVLDAIATIGGLTRASSKKIWISRPAPHGMGCDQILPIDFEAITKGAVTSTNYQLFPGDRVFIAEDRLIALDTMISKILNPFERMLGFTLLGSQTIQSLQRFPEGRFF
jgi:polysaccharide export outer membrane protein